MLKAVKNKIQRMGLKVRGVLTNQSGDQMTGWLIVVLIVVVVVAVFQNHQLNKLMTIIPNISADAGGTSR